MQYLYPIFLCMIPIHTIFGINKLEIPAKKYLEAITVISILVTAGCLGLNLFIHNLLLSELIFCVIFYLLIYTNKAYFYFSAEILKQKTGHPVVFRIVYLFFCLIAAYLIYKIFRNINLTLFSKIVFYIAAFMNLFMLADNFKFAEKKEIQTEIEEDVIKDVKKENLPDIYHIVLDTHMGFEDEEYRDEHFFKELEKRGFYNYTNCRSNYNMTHLSMPSILNMDYLHNIFSAPKYGQYKLKDIVFYYRNNKLWSFLNKLNYKLNIVTEPNFNNLFKGSPLMLNKHNDKGINNILRLLCFYSFFSFCLRKYVKTKKIKAGLLKTYQNLCSEKNQNCNYNFLHILAPHFPYLYDEDGRNVPHTDIANIDRYLPYEKYINKKIIDILDNIKKNMKPNSIIVIQGDHGLHFEKERHNKILCSVYFPDKDYADIPQNLTAVNLFRYILNKNFNTHFEYLPNQLFYSSQNYLVSPSPSSKEDAEYDADNHNYTLYNWSKLKETLENKAKKYKNKKIMLYGAGKYFEFIKANFDLSKFDIIAVSDKKFIDMTTLQYDENIGYNVISPEKISTLKPDIVIFTVLQYENVIEYFENILFKDKKNRFKYELPVKDSLYRNALHNKWVETAFP